MKIRLKEAEFEDRTSAALAAYLRPLPAHGKRCTFKNATPVHIYRV